MIGRWWHSRRHGELYVNRHMSVPAWDPSAKGILWRCDCGKVWAK